MLKNPAEKIPCLSADRPAGPPVAEQGHHDAADLDEHRSQGRKSGSLRADECRSQAAHVRDAGPHRLQTYRGGLPGRLRNRFRLHPQADRGGQGAGRRPYRGADPGASRTHRPHHGVAAGREERHPAFLQCDGAELPRDRFQPGQAGRQIDRDRKRAPDQGTGRKSSRKRTGPSSTAPKSFRGPNSTSPRKSSTR